MNRAWGDSVHLNTFVAKFFSEGFCKSDYRRFRGSVRTEERTGGSRPATRKKNNLAAPLSEHDGNCHMSQIETAEQIDFDGAAPFIRVDRLRRPNRTLD